MCQRGAQEGIHKQGMKGRLNETVKWEKLLKKLSRSGLTYGILYLNITASSFLWKTSHTDDFVAYSHYSLRDHWVGRDTAVFRDYVLMTKNPYHRKQIANIGLRSKYALRIKRA